MYTVADLFKMQDTLNKRVGLNIQDYYDAFNPPTDGTTDGQSCKIENHIRKLRLAEAGKWIDDMLKAMANEMEELRNCTYWKHWCSEAQEGRRYEIKDIEAARKEVIDMLHFWISLAQILGMKPEMVCGMYGTKLQKNIKRQDDGYSIEVKDRAWQLFLAHPHDCPASHGHDRGVYGLEDLSDEVVAYYIEWAKRGTGQADNCLGPGESCKYCGQPGCQLRRYLSTIPGGKNED